MVTFRRTGGRPANRGISRTAIPATNSPAQPCTCTHPCAWISHGTRSCPVTVPVAASGIHTAIRNPPPRAAASAAAMNPR